MNKATIAIDFDGVVNSYKSGWTGGLLPDPPNPGAFDFIRKLQEVGYTVAIHSTRAVGPAIEQMLTWFRLHGLEEDAIQALVVTAKKPMAKLYIDARGYRFIGTFPSLEEVAALGEAPGRTVTLKTAPERENGNMNRRTDTMPAPMAEPAEATDDSDKRRKRR